MTTSSTVLDGKIAIVTGAASPIGMGRSITTALVRAGARVAMLDINEDWLDQTANDMRELGGDDAVLPVVADVTDPESVEHAVERTIKEMGGLHILVNNAGINLRSGGFSAPGETGRRTDFWDIDPAGWLRVIAVNLSGPFIMSHAVAGHMIQQGHGRIISVTTSMDTMWRKGGAPYGPLQSRSRSPGRHHGPGFGRHRRHRQRPHPRRRHGYQHGPSAGRRQRQHPHPTRSHAVPGRLDCLR